jgi:hypothetical protein
MVNAIKEASAPFIYSDETHPFPFSIYSIYSMIHYDIYSNPSNRDIHCDLRSNAAGMGFKGSP